MRRTLSLVLLAIVAIFTLAACGEVSHQITVTAPNASDLCGMYVSAAGEDAYGENELKDGAVLAAKTETNIPVKAAGNYDLKLVTCDGQEKVMNLLVP